MLRREIWVNHQGNVSRYNLAYINPLLCSQDSGRVLGYDNAHGEHHKHYMGVVTLVSCAGFRAIERRFECDWQALMREIRNAKG